MKQKPETPLPWSRKAGHYQRVRSQDIDYFIHAANAYPKLVEALSATLDCPCTLKERDSGHRVGCNVPERVDLLHSLGEYE